MNEEKRQFPSGVTSTKQIRLSLIPHNGLVNAATRFELGLETHKEKAYNALSTNKNALTDVFWLIDRLSHAIEHCYKAIEILRDTRDPHRCKDDAGAIAWCGLVLGEAAFYKPPLNDPLKDQNSGKHQPMEWDPSPDFPSKVNPMKVKS